MKKKEELVKVLNNLKREKESRVDEIILSIGSQVGTLRHEILLTETVTQIKLIEWILGDGKPK